MHCDRFYPSVKIFFSLEDIDDEQGPFNYCPGSHKITAARVAAERDLSIHEALMWEGRKTKSIPRCLNWRGTLFHRNIRGASAGKDPREENSLLVANVTGMHARGHIAAGHSRKMLRLLYHYVHALYFAQRLIFGLVSTVSLLN